MPIFLVFSLTRPAIEPGSTVAVADTVSTGPLGVSLGQVGDCKITALVDESAFWSHRA